MRQCERRRGSNYQVHSIDPELSSLIRKQEKNFFKFYTLPCLCFLTKYAYDNCFCWITMVGGSGGGSGGSCETVI